LGAAFLAGLGVGFFENREALISLLTSGGETFTPRMQETERARLLEGWARAVNACRTF
jgi:glycerol kinase